MAGARSASQSFYEYIESGEECDFYYGVGEYRAFMMAYLFVNDNKTDPNYLYLNDVYGQMVLRPDKAMEQAHVLSTVMWILGEDYADSNAYNQLANLANLLKYGG